MESDKSMVVRTAILLISQDNVVAESVTASVVQRLRQSLVGLMVLHQEVTGSQRHWVEEVLRRWCDEEEIELILTIGGTFPAAGLSEAEILPEATTAVVERLIPSLPELMRMQSFAVNANAILDRGVAGIRGRTLIVNLPGSPELTNLFLNFGAGPIAAILDYIHPELAADQSEAERIEKKRSSHKLDEAEFAAFLRSRQDRKRG